MLEFQFGKEIFFLFLIYNIKRNIYYYYIHVLQGIPQWIIIHFEQECVVNSFEIEFQGGFVGKDCHLEVGDKETKFYESFYPEDKNTIQMFNLKNSIKAKTFKFVFNESTDFFGRIIIYKLSLYS